MPTDQDRFGGPAAWDAHCRELDRPREDADAWPGDDDYRLRCETPGCLSPWTHESRYCFDCSRCRECCTCGK